MSANDKIITWIKTEMERQNISAKKLEKISGVSRHTIGNTIKGKTSPSLIVLLAIIGALRGQLEVYRCYGQEEW